VFAGLGMLSLSNRSIDAAITDRVYFAAPPLVLVWGVDVSSAAAVVTNFALLTTASQSPAAARFGGNQIAIRTGNVIADEQTNDSGSMVSFSSAAAETANVQTVYEGVLDTLQAESDWQRASNTSRSQQHTFFVASNAPFDIYAHAGAVTYSGGFNATKVPLTTISWRMSIATVGAQGKLTWGGSAAQDPSVGGAGLHPQTNLQVLTTPTKVFAGGRRTAAAGGAIVDQSVRFTANYDFHYQSKMGAGSLKVPVSYVVYTP
jgi:hypothetical protein